MWKLCALVPKSMQQIAMLILMCLIINVQSIRNVATSTGSDITDTNNEIGSDSGSLTQRTKNDYYTIEYEGAGTSNYLPPTELIGFTLADATPSHHNAITYSQQQQQQQRPHTNDFAAAATSNVEFSYNQKQLQQQQQQQQHQQRQQQQQASLVPVRLQTAPILSYRDPYTDEHHHYTPTPYDHHYQQHQHQHEHEQRYGDALLTVEDAQLQPQEYTVQSSLLVDANQPYDSPHHKRYTTTFGSGGGGGGGGGGEYQRPGLVFEEPLGVSSIAHNYATRPLGPFTRPTRPPLPPPPPPPPPPSSSFYSSSSPSSSYGGGGGGGGGVRQRPYLSYDSHDYPPPSYYQQQLQQQQHQHQQQPSVQQLEEQKQQKQQQQLHFQSPQRQDTTVPNYANNFGNYLPNSQPHHQQQQQQPPQQQQQHQHQQEIFYQPYREQQQQQLASLSPSRPTPAYNNYYDYQLGELPPRPPTSSRPTYNIGYRPPPPPPPQQYQQQQQLYPSQYPSPYPPSPPQRIPPPTTAAAAASLQSPLAGLANLATFITDSTQSYAPQFTNLLLGTLGVGGGGGGGSGSGGGGLGSSIASNLVGGSRPLNMQLIKALENIARNDELQCVPKVLCQMIARQTERGQLPNFVTSPAITNFLAGFPTASPALIYGRAALLGISGGESSCTRSYAKCPKNEYEILYYLNNHRGGFFKFFSEPEEKEQQQSQQASTQNDASSGIGGATSIFSLLSALTGMGGGGGGGASIVAPTARPKPSATTTEANDFDITGGIGNFFSQVLSDYLGGGVEYQRRRRRDLSEQKEVVESQAEDRNTNVEEEIQEEEQKEDPFDKIKTAVQLPEDFHDVEDDEDTQNNETPSATTNDAQFGDVEGRILHKDVLAALEHPKFFPDDEEQQERLLRNLIQQFNAGKLSRKLKFPTAVGAETQHDQTTSATSTSTSTEAREEEHSSEGYGHVLFEGETVKDSPTPPQPLLTLSALTQRKYRRRGKKLIFKETADDSETSASQHSTATLHQQQLFTPNGGRVIFPDGTRTGRILNRPNELSGQSSSEDSDKFVISNAHRSEGARGENDDASYYSSSSHHSVDNRYSSSSSSSSSSSITNRYSSTYSANNSGSNTNSNINSYLHNGNSNKAYKMFDSRPASTYSNMRYSSRYQTASATRRPTQPPHEDNKNIYVTNGQGVTEYFITPEGRKVYL